MTNIMTYGNKVNTIGTKLCTGYGFELEMITHEQNQNNKRTGSLI